MMKHTIMVDEYYGDEGEEDAPLTFKFEIDVPDRIYLQVVDGEDGTPANDDWWTHAQERIFESDVVYVPLAHLEEAQAERDALRAEVERLRAALYVDVWWSVTPEHPAVGKNDAQQARLDAMDWRPVNEPANGPEENHDSTD